MKIVVSCVGECKERQKKLHATATSLAPPRTDLCILVYGVVVFRLLVQFLELRWKVEDVSSIKTSKRCKYIS